MSPSTPPTVAVGDIVEFAAWENPGDVRFRSDLTTPIGKLALSIQRGEGVLEDICVMRHAAFRDGTLQVVCQGMEGRFFKAKIVGKVKLEATTHRGGTRKETRSFEIDVVKKQDVPFHHLF